MRPIDRWGERGSELAGIGLLACAVFFNAFFLAPELRIGRLAPNDSTFHLAASERLGESLKSGEPLLDPWVSEWSLGYPVWRSYQPLPHLLAAGVLALSPGVEAHATWFAALQYLLIVLLPASVYLGARLLGLAPGAAGLAACLAWAPSAWGDFGRYGLGYGAATWRGSGLFTQLVALHLLLPCLGVLTRACDSGRRRPLAALLLAVTSLSHIVFGYVAFLSAGLVAVVGVRGERARRTVRLAAIILGALLLLAWFAVPLLLARATINHSRWEDAAKWDSFGAPMILSELLSGRLLDAGRAPILSLLVLVGAVASALAWREVVPRRLLALTGTWLLLFFGRATWGHLLLLVGIPGDFHLHRLQAAFEISMLLLAAWGLARLVSFCWRTDRRVGAAVASVIAIALVMIGTDRARYLRENAAWGEANLSAFATEKSDVEATLGDVSAILAERPGRVSAGLAATWGSGFKVGAVPFYAFLTRAHMDEASFLYHSMSLTSDVMVLRNEQNPAHDVAFGVRAIVAPVTQPPAPHWRRRAIHGRFAVYEASGEGYFGLVDVSARYTGPLATAYEPSAAWLGSTLPSYGIVAALGGGEPALPAFGRWAPFPSPSAELLTPRGQIVSETKNGEVYSARVSLVRECHVLVKITYDPALRATIDGHDAPLLRVTPGFAAVRVPAGFHDVAVRYQPGGLRPMLLILGLSLFAAFVWFLRQPRFAAMELSAAQWLAARTAPLATPRRRAAVALALLAILALRPLVRGRLIDGHDATEYAPRLVEFGRAVADGQLPPVWAPDLGNGFGEPLFEFAPPLLYAAALPGHYCGLRLADSLQFGLLALYAAGAVAVYRLARRWQAGRPAALASTAAWLFAPYISLDLFVRAAFAEASALAVAPIALLALLRALDRSTAARIALASGALALVVLAHNAVALLLLPALAVVVAFSAIGHRDSLRKALAGAAALTMGLCLSAFFWLPALVEKRFVKVELLRQDWLAWSQHLVYPMQLLWSRWGYGVSGPGPNDGMSFAVGPLLVLFGIAGLVFVLRSHERQRRAEGLAFGAAAAIGVWLATVWASPLWSRVETIQYLAYPWRCLFLPALFLPLLATAALSRLPTKAALGAIGLIVLVNLAHTEPKGYLTFDDEFYAPESIAARGINTTTREEYEPRWVVSRPSRTQTRLVGMDAPIEVLDSNLAASRQEFTIRASSPTRIELAIFYYPGWRVTVDGQPTAIDIIPARGTMAFSTTPGEHRVALWLTPTPLRRWSLWLSVAALAVLSLVSLASLRWLARR